MLFKDLLKEERTLLMGVMNLTPDSFSHDGLKSNTPAVNLRYAKAMLASGADILDIGGESSRPGAREISSREETLRVLPTVKILTRNLKCPISIDTYKTETAHACLDAGVSIVNTIKGIDPDLGLLRLVRDYKASIVLMHMRGNPRTMKTKTLYKNLIGDTVSELKVSVEKCLEIGIKKDRIIIDPGIGFSKTPEQNLKILNGLKRFRVFGLPVLVGTSRKSFIGHVLKNEVEDRLFGTAATVAISISNGAKIIRVHDVKAMKDVARITDSILRAK